MSLRTIYRYSTNHPPTPYWPTMKERAELDELSKITIVGGSDAYFQGVGGGGGGAIIGRNFAFRKCLGLYLNGV